MNSKFTGFALFVIGAGIGSVATWLLIKKKYEQLTQEEIDSVKEVFLNRKPVIDNSESIDVVPEKQKKPKDKPDITEYTKKLKEEGYIYYSNVVPENKKQEESENMDKPYILYPEEFGEYEDYETISLTYYEDQILADDDDELVDDDIEDIVGFNSLTHFGEYEDDSVFVRNDRLKCDYEILRDNRKYSDVIKKKPHQVED